MTRPVLLAHSRVFASTRPDAFEQVLRSDLRRVFDRGYGGIPRVVGVRAPGGQWGSPGQVRTIELSGGGSMREELRTVEPPTRFGYLLSGFTGPLRLLVTSIDGEWHFEPSGSALRVTWSWTVRPRGPWGAATMPVVARMWRGYARRGFDNLEALLAG